MKYSLGISDFLEEISAAAAAAAATTKSLQSFPTLCGPIDGSPPGKNTGMGCHFLLQCMKGKSESEVTQLCPTLSDSMYCSLPGSSVHGIFQARLLEWVSIAFSGRDLWSFPFYCFPLLLCTNHWGRLSYRSLLFFGTLHSDGYIFPFLCFLLLFFSQLFVRPPQTAILLFCILLSLLTN